MSETKIPDHFRLLKSDVLHLVRIGSAGKSADVQALARKMVTQYKSIWPDFAEELATYAPRGRALRSAKRPMPVDADSRMTLARLIEAPAGKDPILSESCMLGIQQLVLEHRNLEQLREADLSPCKAALLIGPPGVGKTMSAHWIANQLNRPLVVLDLATSISSFLGKTGQNVRQIFDFCKEFDCVLLLDEVDAIAKKRGDETDLGELKRLVNVLLQELDDWPTGGLILAATNHPALLDPAVWRRFEALIEFHLPEYDERYMLAHSQLETEQTSMLSALADLTEGMSHADIVGRIRAARRAAVLDDIDLSEGLIKVFSQHMKSLPRKKRHDISENLIQHGVSQRMASLLTGTSRNTIRNKSRN